MKVFLSILNIIKFHRSFKVNITKRKLLSTSPEFKLWYHVTREEYSIYIYIASHKVIKFVDKNATS